MRKKDEMSGTSVSLLLVLGVSFMCMAEIYKKEAASTMIRGGGVENVKENEGKARIEK